MFDLSAACTFALSAGGGEVQRLGSRPGWTTKIGNRRGSKRCGVCARPRKMEGRDAPKRRALGAPTPK